MVKKRGKLSDCPTFLDFFLETGKISIARRYGWMGIHTAHWSGSFDSKETSSPINSRWENQEPVNSRWIIWDGLPSSHLSLFWMESSPPFSTWNLDEFIPSHPGHEIQKFGKNGLWYPTLICYSDIEMSMKNKPTNHPHFKGDFHATFLLALRRSQGNALRKVPNNGLISSWETNNTASRDADAAFPLSIGNSSKFANFDGDVWQPKTMRTAIETYHATKSVDLSRKKNRSLAQHQVNQKLRKKSGPRKSVDHFQKSWAKKLQPFRIMIFLDPEISPKFQWPRLVNSHIFHHE